MKRKFKNFPGFDLYKIQQPVCTFIIRNMLPVGLFVCEPRNSFLAVRLDFVIKEYRDLKNARFLFYKSRDIFKAKGYSAFIAAGEVEKHRRYPEQIGFEEKMIEEKKCFILTI